jgi:hypothetical protein
MLAVYKFSGSLEGTPRVRARRFVAVFLLRITHGLRSGGDKRRLRGYGGLGRSRYALAPTPASARIFAPLETLVRFLYRGAKTPQTLMLCGIVFEHVLVLLI